jgi:hypothetical protein
MVKTIEHAVGTLLDQAIVDTVCTDCRMILHKLRLLLEEGEAVDDEELRETHVYQVAVRCYRALHRLEAHVHVCSIDGVDDADTASG